VKRVWVVLAGALAVLSFGGSGATAYPVCAPGKDLTFRAADGTRLVGHRFGSGKTFVVLAHQYGGDLCQWVPYAKRLTSLGYTALAFDLRGFGRSQKRYGDALIRYDRDVVAAAKLARSLGARKVVLVGASLGANAVVAAGAAITPPVDGLVSLSAPGTFRQDAIAAAKQLSVPALFAAGEVDEGGIYATDAKSMYAADPDTDKQLVIVPGAKHGVALVAGPGKVRTAAERFIARVSGRAG
jgi:pimeloyl-ACP methyl ester carboxylesterase